MVEMANGVGEGGGGRGMVRNHVFSKAEYPVAIRTSSIES